MKLFTIPGLSTPGPFGGKQRQMNVDVDPGLLAAKGFSLTDVVNALQASNVIVPAGTARIGEREYNVQLNSSPAAVERFNDLPIGVFDGRQSPSAMSAASPTALPTRATSSTSTASASVYLAILKHADASTLAVVDATRAALPEVQAAAPNGLELKLDFDQSVFVRAAVENVVREAIISSILVSVLILVFLGSWRNTVIVSASIPLSVFAGIIGLFLTGNSINLMTLGGLALAIGLLVDNATVVIENIHRNLMLGKKLTVAILDGSAEVIQPLTVATLAICIVFFPVVMLFGVARYLFIPLAATVVFCMLASYALSFTRGAEFCPSAAGIRPHPSRPAQRFLRSVRPRLRAVSPRLLVDAGRHAAQPRRRPGLLHRLACRHRRRGNHHRAGLLPQRRCRPDQDALPRAAGNTHRGNRTTGPAGRGSRPRDHSGIRTRHRSTILSACRHRSTWRSCRATMSGRWMRKS